MSSPLRLVLDTNVVLSALLWEGRPAELLDHAADDLVQLLTSEELVDELQRSLAKPRLASRLRATGLSPQQHAANYASLATIVTAPSLPSPTSRDPDDDRVLACAVAASADAIVTGDADLLVLGAYAGIPILPVSDCLAVIAALAGEVQR